MGSGADLPTAEDAEQPCFIAEVAEMCLLPPYVLTGHMQVMQ